jgi:outer membrane lipoprotein LolB
VSARAWRGARARWFAIVGVLAAVLLQGCASGPPPVAGPVYTGRIGVRSDATPDRPAHSVSGQFELSGSPAHGQLVLTSPIGTVVARARWIAASEADAQRDGAADIELEADGRSRHFDNFDDLTRAALGDTLPLAAMFYWLAGRPWPLAPAIFEDGRTAFEQLGWRVDRARFDALGLIVADRASPPPALHVRVKLDRDAAASAAAAAPSPAPAASAQ